MGWRDKVRAGCSWAANTWLGSKVLDVTAASLDFCGSVVCIVGGAAMTASLYLDVDIQGEYIVNADTTGVVTENIKFLHMPIEETATIPFSYLGLQQTGGANYNVKDYVDPASIRTYSSIMMAAGAFLRLTSANIQLYRQGVDDEVYYAKRPHLHYSPLSIEDYKFVSKESFSRSLFFICAGSLMTTSFLFFFGLPNKKWRPTYPGEGSVLPNSTYPGPVDGLVVPISDGYGKNITGDGFHFSIDAKVAGSANVSYGALAKIQSNAGLQWPKFVAGTVGTLSALALCSMFSEQIRMRQRKRTERPELEDGAVPPPGGAPFRAMAAG